MDVQNYSGLSATERTGRRGHGFHGEFDDAGMSGKIDFGGKKRKPRSEEDGSFLDLKDKIAQFNSEDGTTERPRKGGHGHCKPGEENGEMPAFNPEDANSEIPAFPFQNFTSENGEKPSFPRRQFNAENQNGDQTNFLHRRERNKSKLSGDGVVV